MTLEPTDALCAIRNCPATPTHHETAESAHWIVTFRYCDEHARELSEGTPVGPAGIDPSRVLVESRGIDLPQTGGIFPTLGPQ